MIDLEHARDLVVRPALEHMGMYSLAAEQLLMGTAAQESAFRYLRQVGGGPAMGLFQMEPETYFDIWANYLRHRRPLADRIRALRAPEPAQEDQIATNLLYAAAMARVHYWRRRAPLPQAGDINGMAAYWKKWYNTPAGKGTEAKFLRSWEQLVQPLYD